MFPVLSNDNGMYGGWMDAIETGKLIKVQPVLPSVTIFIPDFNNLDFSQFVCTLFFASAYCIISIFIFFIVLAWGRPVNIINRIYRYSHFPMASKHSFRTFGNEGSKNKQMNGFIKCFSFNCKVYHFVASPICSLRHQFWFATQGTIDGVCFFGKDVAKFVSKIMWPIWNRLNHVCSNKNSCFITGSPKHLFRHSAVNPQLCF